MIINPALFQDLIYQKKVTSVLLVKSGSGLAVGQVGVFNAVVQLLLPYCHMSKGTILLNRG